MSIELDIVKPAKVKAKYVSLFCKVCDSGTYELLDENNDSLKLIDDYVPLGIFPESGGDYLSLTIDLETGQIQDWKKPTAENIVEAFGLSSVEK
jgi:hypothetical protein